MILTVKRPVKVLALYEGRTLPMTLWPGRYEVEQGENPYDAAWPLWLYLVESPAGVPEGVKVGMAADRFLERCSPKDAVRADSKPASKDEGEWEF